MKLYERKETFLTCLSLSNLSYRMACTLDCASSIASINTSTSTAALDVGKQAGKVQHLKVACRTVHGPSRTPLLYAFNQRVPQARHPETRPQGAPHTRPVSLSASRSLPSLPLPTDAATPCSQTPY